MVNISGDAEIKLVKVRIIRADGTIEELEL